MAKPIQRLLVANRGEIARRVFRACRRLGVETVAVYSEADQNSAHVAEADQAVCVGPAPARESYLRSDAILQAAAETGADAIHPGYGFLSENADFAAAVAARGLTWVGPAPETIRAMGDKQSAREIARSAGVPVVPGSPRFDADLDGIAAAAEAVGFPLLVKAAAGGGGIGMKQVDAPEKLEAVAKATHSMAEKAFGDGSIYLERYIPRARHVEVQVFGFGDGEAVHLFERDCSLQRRFQKVIEESPAPDLPETVRAAMAEAALKLCRATRYAGAGTVEFILDVATHEFFFLEMNTRIQVEHPVTEMATGADLVAMQLEQAAGTLSAPSQSEFTIRKHAVECRIYAEDPARRFLPSPGALTRYREPEPHSDLRIDSAYREGDAVTPFYDPMIAKVIACGETRQAAIEAAIAGLQGFEIEGPRTNLAFLLACLDDDDFRSGRIDTGFLESRRDALVAASQVETASSG